MASPLSHRYLQKYRKQLPEPLGSSPQDKSANKKSTARVLFLLAVQCTIFELLEQHRAEVVAVREQVRYVRERLTKNASPKM